TTKDNQTTLQVIDPLTDPLTKKTLAERTVPGELTNADVSSDFTRVVTIGRNNFLHVYLVKEMQRQSPLESMSAPELFALACEKIRYQEEFKSIEKDVPNKCKGVEQ